MQNNIAQLHPETVNDEQLFSVHEIFEDVDLGLSDQAQNLVLRGRKEACEYTPDRLSYMEWDPVTLRKMIIAKAMKRPLRMFGPSGCGKSEHGLQFCARLNLPVQVWQGHNESTQEEAQGGFVIQGDRTMKWVPGPVAMAVELGHVLLIEEEDMIPRGVMAALHGLLGGKPLVIASNGGQVIKPHPDFWIIATGNTSSEGDVNGDFQGALRHNKATLNRYLHARMDFMPSEKESALLKRAVDDEALDSQIPTLVQLANAIRDLYKRQEVADPITTRQLVAVLESFRRFTQLFKDASFEDAFRTVHFDTLSYEDRVKVAEQYNLCMGGTPIDPEDSFYSRS